MSKIIITLIAISLTITNFGCGFIKEKFLGDKRPATINEDYDTDDQSKDKERNHKLKGPIPINPSHS